MEPGDDILTRRGIPFTGSCVLLCASVVPLFPPYYHGVPSKALSFCALSALALIAASWRRRGGRAAPLPDAIAATVLLLLATAVSAALSRFTGLALREAAFSASTVGLFLAAAVAIREGAWLRRLIVASACSAAVVAAFGLAGYASFQHALDAGRATVEDRSRHLATPFFQHSYLAVQFVLPPAISAIALATRSGGWRRIALFLVAAAPILFAGVSMSRAAWLAGALTGCAIAAIWYGNRREARDARRTYAHLAIAAACVAAMVLLAARGLLGSVGRDAFERATSLLDPKQVAHNFSRVLVWQDTLRLIGDHSPFGAGPGHFVSEFGAHHAARRPLSHAHQQFLHTAAELGIFGLVGLVLLISAPAAAIRRALFGTPRDARGDSGLLAASVGITAIVALGLFESPLQFPATAAWFAAIAGSACGVAARPAAAGRGALSPGLAGGLAIAILAVAAPATIRHARASWIAADAAAALAEGDPGSASALARKARDLAPDHPEVLRLLCESKRAARDLEGAIEASSQALNLAPGQTDLLVLRALCLLESGRPAEAAEDLLRARPRVPDEARAEISFLLANAMFRARRFEEARLLFTDLMQANAHARYENLPLRLAETLLNLGRERALATRLLELFARSVSPRQAAYAERLLEDIDRYYPPAGP